MGERDLASIDAWLATAKELDLMGTHETQTVLQLRDTLLEDEGILAALLDHAEAVEKAHGRPGSGGNSPALVGDGGGEGGGDGGKGGEGEKDEEGRPVDWDHVLAELSRLLASARGRGFAEASHPDSVGRAAAAERTLRRHVDMLRQLGLAAKAGDRGALERALEAAEATPGVSRRHPALKKARDELGYMIQVKGRTRARYAWPSLRFVSLCCSLFSFVASSCVALPPSRLLLTHALQTT